MFNAENFICSLAWSVCSDFGTVRSWNLFVYLISKSYTWYIRTQKEKANEMKKSENEKNEKEEKNTQ